MEASRSHLNNLHFKQKERYVRILRNLVYSEIKLVLCKKVFYNSYVTVKKQSLFPHIEEVDFFLIADTLTEAFFCFRLYLKICYDLVFLLYISLLLFLMVNNNCNPPWINVLKNISIGFTLSCCFDILIDVFKSAHETYLNSISAVFRRPSSGFSFHLILIVIILVFRREIRWNWVLLWNIVNFW